MTGCVTDRDRQLFAQCRGDAGLDQRIGKGADVVSSKTAKPGDDGNFTGTVGKAKHRGASGCDGQSGRRASGALKLLQAFGIHGLCGKGQYGMAAATTDDDGAATAKLAHGPLNRQHGQRCPGSRDLINFRSVGFCLVHHDSLA